MATHEIFLYMTYKKKRGMFPSPPDVTNSISQLTQSQINPLLMFWGWCIRPPFNQNKFCRMRYSQFPVRCVLKPERVVVIRVTAVGATPVAHSLYLFNRARIVICGFPIPTDRAIHFNPHNEPPRCVMTFPNCHMKII
jgi:hypothetical protein